MSGITVELSELDADLWEAFKRGGAWVAHSEYMRVKAENVKLRELVRDYYIYEHSGCYSCHFYNECHSVGCESREPFCIAPIRLGERTCELGVEVDE